jgi:hypothetical protein
MTYFLNRLHFIYPVRDFVDLVVANDGVRYEFVREYVPPPCSRFLLSQDCCHSSIGFPQNTQEFVDTHRPPASILSNKRRSRSVRSECKARSSPNSGTTSYQLLRSLPVIAPTPNISGAIVQERASERKRLSWSFTHPILTRRKFTLSRDAVTQSMRFIIEKHLNNRDRANIPARYWQVEILCQAGIYLTQSSRSQNYGLLTATIALFIGFCHGSRSPENIRELRLCLEALK